MITTPSVWSSSPIKIHSLFQAGADIFRLNFSHGSHEDHLSTIKIIRRIETKLKLQIGILADLQGPKFRIGKVEDKVKLKVNDLFILDQDKKIGSRKRAYLGHNEIYKSIKINSIILIDDGKIKLKVLSKKKDILKTKVLVGGNLSSNKGVNLPNLILDTTPITKKDRDDLTFILENEIDWIALSFVQKVDDVKYVQKIIEKGANFGPK